MFGTAEYIAGPTGAAWTNLMFCRKGAKALCWMPRQLSEFSAYSNLARIAGVQMDYVSYTVDADSTQALYDADYRVDPGAVERALQKTLDA